MVELGQAVAASHDGDAEQWARRAGFVNKQFDHTKIYSFNRASGKVTTPVSRGVMEFKRHARVPGFFNHTWYLEDGTALDRLMDGADVAEVGNLPAIDADAVTMGYRIPARRLLA